MNEGEDAGESKGETRKFLLGSGWVRTPIPSCILLDNLGTVLIKRLLPWICSTITGPQTQNA